jgi:hypothetical protein
MRVPGFMVKQFYVAGSLRNTATGFSVQARNAMADGWLVGIGAISIDGVAIEPAAVTAHRAGESTIYHATEVSRTSPVAFRKGDVVTFDITGLTLNDGAHQLEVELVERDLGSLSLGFSETVAPGW